MCQQVAHSDLAPISLQRWMKAILLLRTVHYNPMGLVGCVLISAQRAQTDS